MGGAMDLVASGSRVIVVMEHVATQNSFKLLKKCSLPLTGKGVVSMVITELAVFENKDGKLILTEIASETTLEKVQEKTGFKIKTGAEIKKF
jgi:3-oxoacid CoA-transferase